MPEIRYEIPSLSVQALLAYAEKTEDANRYTFNLSHTETLSTVMRDGETLQPDNAIFFQAMCVLRGNDYQAPICDTVISDLADVMLYLDFKNIFDRDSTRKKYADRQKKAESMFRPEGICLDFGSGSHCYLAFERSASMSRNARLSFVREDIYTELRERMMLGMKIGMCQLSKLYAYNGLLFSNGTRIENIQIEKKSRVIVIDNPVYTAKDVSVITVDGGKLNGNTRKYTRVEKKMDIETVCFDGEGMPTTVRICPVVNGSLSDLRAHISKRVSI